MFFREASPTSGLFKRWVSLQGSWEVGYCQVMYGIRVRLGRIWHEHGENEAFVYSLDYCTGDNPALSLLVLGFVVKALETVPESVSRQEIEEMFPRNLIKPIDKDSVCWNRLKQLATTGTVGT